LYLDMPLGVHPDSYDVWRNRDLFITGVSAGAPPDPFFTRGQNWGFPPINPIKMRERHYQYWRKVLQTQLRYAGILRLDHVMSLHRLYLVPNGFEATKGVYIGYPAEEMYAILALESSRHQAVIVGEDLGTVPAEVRKSMDVHGVKRMFVLQFEATDDLDEPIGIPPKNAVASLNTHDMPPFSAYWQALDADLRSELGLLDGDGVREAREQRNKVTTALSRMLAASSRLDAAAARTALLDFLARSDADMLLVNLEDLWLENQPQNTPGTSHERPNWRRRLKYTLEEMRADESVGELLELVEAARRKMEKVS
jgi:4-alpha-glucanotransferase